MLFTLTVVCLTALIIGILAISFNDGSDGMFGLSFTLIFFSLLGLGFVGTYKFSERMTIEKVYEQKISVEEYAKDYPEWTKP